MTLTPTAFLIVCPLVFLSGVVDAIAGGGGIISLPAYLFVGLPPSTAIASNKLSSSLGTAISTTMFVRRGYVRLKPALLFVVLALFGAFFGARLTLFLPESILRYGLLAVLPVVAFLVLRRRSLGTAEEARGVKLPLAALSTFFIGLYDGLYGPGTGTFLLLLLTGPVGFSLNEGMGYTKVINLSSNVSALLVFLLNGKVMLPLAGAATLFSIAGQYLGARLALKDGLKIVRPIVLFVLALLFVKVIGDTFF